MAILIRRFCHTCGKYTRWRVESIDKYWEIYTCEVCGSTKRYKTR